ncbi:hypothetical protein [Microvirga massiliensis]|uniref:hypothetical protein n=1 Tax=Microvirga massiliensis TaxID=1033741 RepID=UPI00062BEE3B|nr:hypothetical protein [Microvirga massiliensis]
MAETLLHIAYIKSASMVPPTARLSSTGAQFQDFRGGNGFVMAHRAIMAINLNGRNIATVPNQPSQARLREILKAPQARTDPLTPVANYADRLLEIAAEKPVLECYQRVFDAQKPGRPVEINLVVDETYKMIDILHGCYDQAAEKHSSNLKKRGFVEHKITDGPMRFDTFGPATGDVSRIIDDLTIDGPQSLLVQDRMEQTKIGLFKGNPTEFVYFPPDYLGVSRIVSSTSPPSTVNRDKIEEACEDLSAASQGSSTSVSSGPPSAQPTGEAGQSGSGESSG